MNKPYQDFEETLDILRNFEQYSDPTFYGMYLDNLLDMVQHSLVYAMNPESGKERNYKHTTEKQRAEIVFNNYADALRISRFPDMWHISPLQEAYDSLSSLFTHGTTPTNPLKIKLRNLLKEIQRKHHLEPSRNLVGKFL